MENNPISFHQSFFDFDSISEPAANDHGNLGKDVVTDEQDNLLPVP